MSNNERKKKPIFQSADVESPVEIDPPFKPSEAVLSDQITAEEPLFQEDLHENDPETSVEESPIPTPTEPAPPSTEIWLSGGWRELTDSQKTGKAFHLASDLESTSVTGFWRKTRVLSHFKWVSSGKWSDSLTNQEIFPTPKYYKEVG